MNNKNLFKKGYSKVSNNTYEKIDEETGMTARLIFNDQATEEDNLIIEKRIISILAN